MFHLSLRTRALILGTVLTTITSAAQAAESMCDPAHQDCRTPLLTLIQHESASIDIAMWFMEDQGLADAIVARFRAGVDVRVIVDPRRNTTTPMNAVILAQF